MTSLLSPSVLNLATLRVDNGIVVPAFPVQTTAGIKPTPITAPNLQTVAHSVYEMDAALRATSGDPDGVVEIQSHLLADPSTVMGTSRWYIDEAFSGNTGWTDEAMVSFAQKQGAHTYLGRTIDYKFMRELGLWLSIGVRHDNLGINLRHITFVPDDSDPNIPFTPYQVLALEMRKDRIMEFISSRLPKNEQTQDTQERIGRGYTFIRALAEKFSSASLPVADLRTSLLRNSAPNGLLMLWLAAIFLEAEANNVPSYLREVFIVDKTQKHTLRVDNKGQYPISDASPVIRGLSTVNVFLGSAATYLKPQPSQGLTENGSVEELVFGIQDIDNGGSLRIAQYAPFVAGDKPAKETDFDINPAFAALAAMALEAVK